MKPFAVWVGITACIFTNSSHAGSITPYKDYLFNQVLHKVIVDYASLDDDPVLSEEEYAICRSVNLFAFGYWYENKSNENLKVSDTLRRLVNSLKKHGFDVSVDLLKLRGIQANHVQPYSEVKPIYDLVKLPLKEADFEDSSSYETLVKSYVVWLSKSR